MAYDVIADVHGYSGTLVRLLKELGYSLTGGAWRHPERKAIFLGDFIDRGPQQEETYRIARAMVESGSALSVMGNHEFNAICWTIANPNNPGKFLRDHSESTRRQHSAFLDQVKEGSPLHAEMIAWFWQLPLWLDLEGILVVHAAWDRPMMLELEPMLAPGNKLTAKALEAYGVKDSPTYHAIEAILKGIEAELPAGSSFSDKDGKARNQIRLKWWENGPSTYRQAALMAAEITNTLPELPLQVDPRRRHEDARPVFIGHHALSGSPKLSSPNVACLDFSVINEETGRLCAYRWTGETQLTEENLHSVPVRAYTERLNLLTLTGCHDGKGEGDKTHLSRGV